jgi:SAM-dependent methyltransferase
MNNPDGACCRTDCGCGLENRRLLRDDFPSWADYYWTYQYNLARDFYLPKFEAWDLSPEGLKVLDIGCGDGGFTAALADWGAECTGVEIKPFERKAHGCPRLKFVVQDITAPEAADVLGGGYGLVILRDVIEHIPWDMKAAFLKSVTGFMGKGGRLLVTFPPYYSPFGLHQQTLLKSRLRKLPGLSLLPGPMLDFFMRHMDEPEEAAAAVAELKRCRMTISGFKRLTEGAGLKGMAEKYYLFSPSHEIRYGWKTRRSFFGKVPGARELFVMGTEYLLSLK